MKSNAKTASVSPPSVSFSAIKARHQDKSAAKSDQVDGYFSDRGRQKKRGDRQDPLLKVQGSFPLQIYHAKFLPASVGFLFSRKESYLATDVQRQGKQETRFVKRKTIATFEIPVEIARLFMFILRHSWLNESHGYPSFVFKNPKVNIWILL